MNPQQTPLRKGTGVTEAVTMMMMQGPMVGRPGYPPVIQGGAGYHRGYCALRIRQEYQR